MPPSPRSERLSGTLYALVAYGCWGVFPVYFKALKSVAPLVVLSHRVAWSAVVMSVLVVCWGKGRAFLSAMRSWRVLVTLLASTLLIASNWLVYIWAVASGHILEASLGYFINPLATVALGAVFLRERLTAVQWAAVALALCGVVALAVGTGVLPWISLVLAGTFATYGLLRKTVAVDAGGGLLAETLYLLVPAVGYLVIAPQPWGEAAWGWRGAALLVAAGPVTAIPLLCFAQGARRLPLTTMGFLQYLSPTLQLLTAVVLYGETFGRTHAVAFGFIWAAVLLFLWGAIARSRRAAASSRP